MFVLKKTHLVSVCCVSGLLCIITSISLGIAWTYWSPVLGSCSQVNCGCILYGSSLVTIFIGGDITFCQLVTFCPLLPALIVFGVAIYYAYQIRTEKSNRLSRRSEYQNMCVNSRSRPNEKQYPCSFIILVIIILITLVIEASFILEGYTWTCKEYKKHVIRYLNATGDLATVVDDRLPCSVMFDFLDYLQPDILIRRPGIRSTYHRTNRINTAAILQTGLITSWTNVIMWSLVIIFIGIGKLRGVKL